MGEKIRKVEEQSQKIIRRLNGKRRRAKPSEPETAPVTETTKTQEPELSQTAADQPERRQFKMPKYTTNAHQKIEVRFFQEEGEDRVEVHTPGGFKGAVVLTLEEYQAVIKWMADALVRFQAA